MPVTCTDLGVDPSSCHARARLRPQLEDFVAFRIGDVVAGMSLAQTRQPGAVHREFANRPARVTMAAWSAWIVFVGLAGIVQGSLAGIGFLVAGVALVEHEGAPHWLVFNVGDSRVYRHHGSELTQLTIDHSLGQELVDAGELRPEDLADFAQRNVITRAIGAGSAGPTRMDWSLLVAGPDDRLLICSDGLTGELSEQLIAASLLEIADPQVAADVLVREAVEAGGRDNVTAVVVDVVELDGPRRSDPGHRTHPDLDTALEDGGDTLPDALEPGQEGWS